MPSPEPLPRRLDYWSVGAALNVGRLRGSVGDFQHLFWVSAGCSYAQGDGGGSSSLPRVLATRLEQKRAATALTPPRSPRQPLV